MQELVLVAVKCKIYTPPNAKMVRGWVDQEGVQNKIMHVKTYNLQKLLLLNN